MSASRRRRIPVVTLAETYAQLRRMFALAASDAPMLLEPWTSKAPAILAPSASSIATVFRRAIELDLGGNVHAALVATTCVRHRVPLVTLDRRQHQLALAMGADSRYLLAD